VPVVMASLPLPPPAPELGTPDEALVDRVLGGDLQAFELLMRRNNERLYRTIRSLVPDEDEVEDLMQQAYLLAFTRLGQFAHGARFSSWLLRIGLNEALQRLRRDRRWPRAAPEVLEEEPSMHATPEQGLARAQLNHLLEQLVDELPESHRSVLVLREVQQLSTAEVAEALGLSADNVKQRLSRAKAMLRDALEQRTGASLAELYPFEAPRCDRVVAGVLARLPVRH
ncbi:MAG TPA: RNA polymerase sigma factor, partial [Myxococcaceae bacterium]|nr:RNA polymerase sigma factor [Myxococcaceae bacterium]